MSAASPVIQILADKSQRLDVVDAGKINQCLRQSGLVLLRGFDINLADFEAFTCRWCNEFHDVGTRQSLLASDGDGYTSEVHRKNFNLFVHSEGAYRPWPPPPDLCFFNCVQSWGTSGGETTLVDGVEFLQKLPDDLRRRFEQQGIIYEAHWDKERWQTEFSVSNEDELHARLNDRPEYEYLLDGDAIQIRCHTAAISISLDGRPAFANGLLAHLPDITHPSWREQHVHSKDTNRIFFGNGEFIQNQVIHRLIDIQDEIAINHGWERNDLLVVDNRRFMHGRRMTQEDCERVIRSRFGLLSQEHV
jgi:alpha-ketoglutarate-dependent taurine dioxygenase